MVLRGQHANQHGPETRATVLVRPVSAVVGAAFLALPVKLPDAHTGLKSWGSGPAGSSARDHCLLGAQLKSCSPTKPPGAHPGGMANTAEPTGVVHSFSRSSSSRLRWMGTNCWSTSAW